ncbi:MAG: discoidin domain-containing protein [Bacteroidales bacterium]|nr:discoidin domain-containing protein [Bacteroidales bacterium]MCF8458552.1 discoidin domain-containing protein [Bacteroidales bacterium]
MGGLNFSFNWLGFEGVDMEFVVDFEQATKVEKISMNFLKALVSWVFLPKKITIESSLDGINYTLLKTSNPDVENRNFRVESVPFIFDVPDIEARYLRVKASSLKTCPEWHRGYGEPCWIFIDEIVVE